MASKKLCLLKQVPDEELIGENSQALQKFLKNTKEFARDIEASSKNLFEKLLLDIQNEGQRTMPEQLLAFIEDTIRDRNEAATGKNQITRRSNNFKRQLSSMVDTVDGLSEFLDIKKRAVKSKKDKEDASKKIQVLNHLNGKLKYKGNLKNNKYHGQGILNHYNGNLMYRGEFVDGKIHGKERMIFHMNGNLQYNGEVNMGVFEGNGALYHENGCQRFNGCFKEDRPHGTNCQLYYNNGNTEYEGALVDGLFEGYGHLYHNNGNLEYEGEFKDGAPTGSSCLLFFENGTVRYRGQMTKGKYNGYGLLNNKRGHQEYKGMFDMGRPLKGENKDKVIDDPIKPYYVDGINMNQFSDEEEEPLVRSDVSSVLSENVERGEQEQKNTGFRGVLIIRPPKENNKIPGLPQDKDYTEIKDKHEIEKARKKEINSKLKADPRFKGSKKDVKGDKDDKKENKPGKKDSKTVDKKPKSGSVDKKKGTKGKDSKKQPDPINIEGDSDDAPKGKKGAADDKDDKKKSISGFAARQTTSVGIEWLTFEKDPDDVPFFKENDNDGYQIDTMVRDFYQNWPTPEINMKGNDRIPRQQAKNDLPGTQKSEIIVKERESEFKEKNPERFDKYDPEVRDDPNWLIKKKEFPQKRPKQPPPRVKPEIKPPPEVVHRDYSTLNKKAQVQFAEDALTRKEDALSIASPTKSRKGNNVAFTDKQSEKETMAKQEGLAKKSNRPKSIQMDLVSNRGDCQKSPTKGGVKDREVAALKSPGKPNIESMRDASKEKEPTFKKLKPLPTEGSEAKNKGKSKADLNASKKKKTPMSDNKSKPKRAQTVGDLTKLNLETVKGSKSKGELKDKKDPNKEIEEKLSEEKILELFDDDCYEDLSVASVDSYKQNNPLKLMQNLAAHLAIKKKDNPDANRRYVDKDLYRD